jgi:hypothetical protein
LDPLAAPLEATGVCQMTADELAASVRAALTNAGDIREVRMFGGIGFMLNGNMVAASRRGLRTATVHTSPIAQNAWRPHL